MPARGVPLIASQKAKSSEKGDPIFECRPGAGSSGASRSRQGRQLVRLATLSGEVPNFFGLGRADKSDPGIRRNARHPTEPHLIGLAREPARSAQAGNDCHCFSFQVQDFVSVHLWCDALPPISSVLFDDRSHYRPSSSISYADGF